MIAALPATAAIWVRRTSGSAVSTGEKPPAEFTDQPALTGWAEPAAGSPRIALALLVLAAALLCMPGAPSLARLATVRPRPRRRLPVPPGRLVPTAVGLVAGVLAAGVAGGLVGIAVAELVRHRRRRARERAAALGVATQLAESLARIVEELRSGAHPAAALEGVTADGPLAAPLLVPAAAAARLGEEVPAALARSAREAPPAVGRELHRLAAAWALAERHGAPLADLVGGVLTDLRWRLAFESRVRARLAGPRATAGVLTALPVLGIGLGQLLGAAPLAVLRAGLLGQVLLLVGAGLLIAGLTWSDRIASGPVVT